MSVLPQNRSELIAFCESHADAWAASPTAIGLTAGQVTALTTAAGAARDAQGETTKARNESKARTAEYNTAVAALRERAAVMVATIKSFADQQASPAAIYAAAQIPQPAPAAPLPPPGRASDFIVTLVPTGAVTLSWTATDASASSGAFFSIARKLPGESFFQTVGSTPGSTSISRRISFTDESIPSSAAASGAQYVVRGFRGQRAGEFSDALTVQFGIDGPSFTMEPSSGIKLAA